jgi:tellurite methyltransferase
MAEFAASDPPSEFVVRWAEVLFNQLPAPRRALDLAMGHGRHADALARAGFRVFGVDLKLDNVRDAVARAAAGNLIVRGWCADLTSHPLPPCRFELLLVTRYLQRDLFPAIHDAIVPGGAVMYETFTRTQRALGRGPTSPDHLLEPGELGTAFHDFEVLFYEETPTPDAVARIVARKPHEPSS